MASKDAQIRRQLTALARSLRETGTIAQPAEAAEALDQVLTPGGWGILRRTDPSNLAPNLPIRMTEADRDRIKAAHEKAKKAHDKAQQSLPAAERVQYTLAAVVNEGFTAFLDGTFVPEQPGRSEYGAGEEKVNLNVRADAGLRERVKQTGEERSDELGWTPKAMHVAAAYLMHKYPAPKASRART